MHFLNLFRISLELAIHNNIYEELATTLKWAAHNKVEILQCAGRVDGGSLSGL